MARYDLTIRGAGIFGLSIAWEAVRRGAHVRVIETQAIGAGSSGGVVGALAPHVPENWNPKKQFQLESLLMAEAFFASATEASGLPTGYARTGRLQPLADAAAVTLAQQRHATARDLWQGLATWSVIPTPQGDWHPASPTGLVVHDTLTARINPRQTAAALVAAIGTRGQVILGDAPDDGPTIWATGIAGLDALSASLGRTVGAGVKGQAALLRYDAANLPQLFVDTLHIVPHADGTVAIGSTSEHTWADPTSTDAQLDTLIARACAALPALQGTPVLDRWAGLRPRARSRAPVLGEWPGRPGHFIANGGFKIGFGMAPKVAQTMVDLVLEGRDTIPDDFRTAAL
jgi:glycine/D-amino acid oxidase-like deaminating enzyme